MLERFAADAGRSVLRVPLEQRRAALEEIPWVEQAHVQRILPNRIRVELVERKPVAFLRLSTELALIDADGVILDQPLQGTFRFPVVTGLHEMMSRADRRARMRLAVAFLADVERFRPGAGDYVSELDLGDPADLRATIVGLPELGNPAAEGQTSVLVHFGAGDFDDKFRMFVENIGPWRAAAGRVESVDLRFERQVVVNPESRSTPAAGAYPRMSRVR